MARKKVSKPKVTVEPLVLVEYVYEHTVYGSEVKLEAKDGQQAKILLNKLVAQPSYWAQVK